MTKQEYYLNKISAFSDHKDRLVTKLDENSIKNVKRIHITAVCGKAMASLAQLLVESGYEVSGSDVAFYPPMGNVIQALNIKTYTGFDEKNILNEKGEVDVDVMVMGNSVGPQNPEAVFARTHNIPQISVAEALQYFIFKQERKVLVVSGTHGKTTVTGMLAHVLHETHQHPGYLIGGVDQQTNKSAELGKPPYFVIEGDEYDTSYFDKSPKFLNYTPASAILTSVEMDHVDIYSNFEDYKQAFTFLAQDLPESGYLVVCADNKEALNISKQTKANVIAYSTKDRSCNFYAHIIPSSNHKFEQAEIYKNGELVGTLSSQLFGEYNIQNCVSVFALCDAYGIDQASILNAIQTYKGMKRRQEELFNGDVSNTVKNVVLVDDYAHHPTAVIETLKGLRQKYDGSIEDVDKASGGSKHRFLVAFEFASGSSTKRVFEEMYEYAFTEANMLYLRIAPPKADATPEQLEKLLRPAEVARIINEELDKKAGLALGTTKKAKAFYDVDELKDAIVKDVQSNDVVIIMASHSFGGLQDKLVTAFKGN